ncbi:HDOD domain-containing protein [Alteromonas facilis]|uniref:HDOD domain-containing protein n=1 Tax=Alteromonas facilis TaxID=2048004 RepID=UPI000C28B0B0|nr:HDOD domain-containing protein [Alteromonas facilis]
METEKNALLQTLVDKINNDTLVLPTLPAIAMRVRETAQDPDVNLNKMADVIALDPSLSARIIKLANSALYARSVKAETVTQAVNRIGLVQIKNNAMALAMEQLFLSSNEVIKKYIDQIWERTVNVVAHALPLFEDYKRTHRSSPMDADVMTLALLLHNIGVLPILTEAERMGSNAINSSFLNLAIQKLSGQIGGAITREWDFDEGVIQVAESWRNLHVQNDAISYVDFVRLGAVAAGYMKSKKAVILQLSAKKSLLDSPEYLESGDYLQRVEEKRALFE